MHFSTSQSFFLYVNRTGTNVDELITNYPDFAQLADKQELLYLLAFRNIIRIALLIIPPQGNKQLLLNIGGRLEGSGNEYITGTGQKVSVTRRVAIYEQEGKVTCQKKKPKKNPSSDLNRYQQHEFDKVRESDIQDRSHGISKNSFMDMIPQGFTPDMLAHPNYQSILPHQSATFHSLHSSTLLKHQQMLNAMDRPATNPAANIIPSHQELKRQRTMDDWQKTLPVMQRNDSTKSYKSIFDNIDGSIRQKMQVHPDSHFFFELESNVEPSKGILAVNNSIRNGLLSDMTKLFGPWKR